MIKRINGLKARFCNANCASGFQADRDSGAIYPATKFPTGKFVNVEPASIISNTCAYCGDDVKGIIPPSHEDIYLAAYGHAHDAPAETTPA